MLRRDTRVFISAVSKELGSVRTLVKQSLEDSGYHTDDGRDDQRYHGVEQTNFPLDHRQLAEKLRNLIGSCDAVIHIAGQCYGAEPKRPAADAPRRSYTQLEYDISRQLDKPVCVIVTADDFPADAHEPEDGERAALQASHRDALRGGGFDYLAAATREQIADKVRSLPLKVEKLIDELTTVDQKLTKTGRRLSRWLVAVAVLVLLSVGIGGYVAWQQKLAREEAQTVEQVQNNSLSGFWNN